MFDFFNAQHKGEGLSPGTLIYTGKPHEASAIVRQHRIGSGAAEPQQVDPAQVTRPDKQPVWIDVEGLHDLEAIRAIGATFGLHDLILEDIVNPVQRPKAELYEDQLFLVFQDPTYTDGELHANQITMVLGPTWLLSFRPFGIDPFRPIVERIRRGGGRLGSLGPDYYLYTLLDALVDRVFRVVMALDEKLEYLEERLIDNASPDTSVQRDIDRQKKTLINLRRIIVPLSEVMATVTQPDYHFFKKETRIFLRDVKDHIHQQIEFLEVARERIKDLSDVYHTHIGRQTNKIALALTLLGAIFIPITFVASVFGMNFQHMPGLTMRNGFALTLGFMFCLASAMFLYFRFKRWF